MKLLPFGREFLKAAPCPREPAINLKARKSFPAGRAGSVARNSQVMEEI
jgi:hypothetical protein